MVETMKTQNRPLSYETVIDMEVFYQTPATGEIVYKVTITARGYKRTDELISDGFFYQDICETVFFIGSREAWNTYHSVSVASREKEFGWWAFFENIFNTVFSVVSLFDPKAVLFKTISALSSVYEFTNGINTSLSWFELAAISKFDKYVLNKILTTNDEEIAFLFSVIDCSIEYANQKSDIIYKAY